MSRDFCIEVNPHPVPFRRRCVLARAFLSLAWSQLIGTRHRLNIYDCGPIEDAEAK